MVNSILVLSVAFITSLITVFLTIRITTKHEIFDSIDDRKIHSGNIPRLGGIGIFVGFMSGLVLMYVIISPQSLGNNLWALLGGSAVIFIMGVWDDFKPWRPRYKLLAQCLAAVLVLLGNYTFSRITLSSVDFVWDLGFWRYPLTFAWIIGVTNAFNLIDGLDGLAGSLAAFSTLIFATFFFKYDNMIAVLVCGLFALSVSGFLVFNLPFPKAKIFMGDSGAMLLGLLLSSAAITLTGQIDANAITSQQSSSKLLPLLLPFTVLAIPLIDLGMAIVRRLLAGRSPFSADREHLHHRILNLGSSQRQTTVILYLWTAMFAVPTVVAAFLPLWVALVTGLAILVASLTLIGWTYRRSRKSVTLAKNLEGVS